MIRVPPLLALLPPEGAADNCGYSTNNSGSLLGNPLRLAGGPVIRRGVGSGGDKCMLRVLLCAPAVPLFYAHLPCCALIYAYPAVPLFYFRLTTLLCHFLSLALLCHFFSPVACLRVTSLVTFRSSYRSPAHIHVLFRSSQHSAARTIPQFIFRYYSAARTVPQLNNPVPFRGSYRSTACTPTMLVYVRTNPSA